MKEDLLAILVCPRTKKPLKKADESIIAGVNRQIEEGHCTDIGGNAVKRRISSGLYEETESVLYIIRDSIPVLIYENGIKVS